MTNEPSERRGGPPGQNIFDELKGELDALREEGADQGPVDPGPSSHWSLLYDVTHLLNTRHLDLSLFFDTILDRAIRLTGADRGFLMLDDGQGRLEIRHARDLAGKSLVSDDFEFSRTVVDEVVKQEDLLFIPNVAEDTVLSASKSIVALKIRSVMCAPLRVKIRSKEEAPSERRRMPLSDFHRILGVIYVDSETRRHHFGEDDLTIFRALANQATTVLLTATVYQEATTDALTGFPNRRQFERIVEDEYRLAEKLRVPFSVFLTDIEGLSQVNERYGHATGDRVIRAVSDAIRAALRQTDVAGRYGGDKIAVLLPGTDEEGAKALAERLVGAVEEAPILERPGRIRIRVGVAVYPTHARNATNLIPRADQALFQAKKEPASRLRIWERKLARTAGRTDRLAGILTGDPARDYRNVLMLLETINAVNLEVDLERLLVRVVDVMIDLTRAQRGILLLYGGKEGALERRVARARGRVDLEPPVEYDEGLVARVLARREPTSDQDTRAFGQTMCVPLEVRDKILGAMLVDGAGTASPFTDSDLTFFQALAREVSIAIENARLYAEAKLRRVELEEKQREIEELNRRLEEKVRRQSIELEVVKDELEKNIQELVLKYNYDRIVGASAAMREVFRLLDKVTDSDVPVLVRGESGTGKDLVAKTIHYNGPRSRGRFLSENCAAIHETLLESELFGHTKGAFTGAHKDKKGLFELASGGTLFLDEIGDMSLALQSKFLRVLEEGMVRPVGGSRQHRVDVRIVSATNKDLSLLIREGKFREDLYFRLNVVGIELPPLRDRKEDIPLLVETFLAEQAARRNEPAKRLGKSAMEVLFSYEWPGNVRELRNLLERLAVIHEGEEIGPDAIRVHLRPGSLAERAPLPPGRSYKEAKRHFEAEYVAESLRRTGGNVSAAARLMQLERRYVYELMNRHGLERRTGEK
ncbi:MAG: sigma 54-interacting transcriptional regulator [Planctomycetes bacterium]|nr:sigma 54-interacting transcriptional regulator [Planctomycetota bacterium]